MAASVQAFQPHSLCTTRAIRWERGNAIKEQQHTKGYYSPTLALRKGVISCNGDKSVENLPKKGAFRSSGHVSFQRNVGCSAQVADKEQVASCGPVDQDTFETIGQNVFGTEFQLGEGALQYLGPVGLDGHTRPTLFEAVPEPFSPDASCHIVIGSGDSLQQEQKEPGLLKERAHLEASFEGSLAKVSSLVSQDKADRFEARLSAMSPLSSDATPQDEDAPEDMFQRLQSILVNGARILGAIVLASTLTLCSANPALAARSMGRAGGGSFSSSRSSSSGGSRSSGGSSSRSSSSTSSRSSFGGSSSSSFGSSSRSSSSGGGHTFSLGGSSPSSSSKSSSRSGSSKSSGGSSGSGLGSFSTHSSSGTPNRSSSNGSKGASGKGAAGKASGSGSGKGGWFGGGTSIRIEEEPHVQLGQTTQSSPFHNPPPTIHLHASTPDRIFTNHTHSYYNPGPDNRVLDALLEALRGPRGTATCQPQTPVPPQAEQPKSDVQEQPDLGPQMKTENLKPQDPFPHDVFVPLALTLLTAAGVYWGVTVALQGAVDSNAATGYSYPPTGATPTGEYDYNRKADLMTIVKIQVALLGQAKSVQAQMDKLCENADTTSEEGLHKFLTETLLVISRHSAYWAYGNSQMSPMGHNAAEGRYQQIVMEERSKAEQETLVNTDGKLSRTPSVRNADDDPPPNEFVVVTIIAALQGNMKSRDPAVATATRDTVKGAMRALSQVKPSDLQVLDILWVPQEDDDALTHAELIENFTDLTPM